MSRFQAGAAIRPRQERLGGSGKWGQRSGRSSERWPRRTESKRRRLAIILTIIVGFLLWYWAGIRELRGEFGYSLLCGGLFSGIFWLLIGRYNPVADSDETIQVLGMDD